MKIIKKIFKFVFLIFLFLLVLGGIVSWNEEKQASYLLCSLFSLLWALWLIFTETNSYEKFRSMIESKLDQHFEEMNKKTNEEYENILNAERQKIIDKENKKSSNNEKNGLHSIKDFFHVVFSLYDLIYYIIAPIIKLFDILFFGLFITGGLFCGIANEATKKKRR